MINKINHLVNENNKLTTIIGVTMRETVIAENICRKLGINFI